jgi:pescadillo
MKKLTEKEEHAKKQRELFKKQVFFLGRETPIYSLQYLVLSFGGLFSTDEDDLSKFKITHQVMDRPLVGKLDSTKEYVQPQWLIDSLNNLHLLPTQPYRPGVAPPPHLSPFVDNAKEGYVPTRQNEINQLKGDLVDESESDEEDVKSEEEAPVVKKAVEKPAVVASKGDADSSSEEEESADEASKKKLKQVKNLKVKRELQKEQEELGKILMTKKQRQLYDQVDKSNSHKKDQAKKLKQKRSQIEKKK